MTRAAGALTLLLLACGGREAAGGTAIPLECLTDPTHLVRFEIGRRGMLDRESLEVYPLDLRPGVAATMPLDDSALAATAADCLEGVVFEPDSTADGRRVVLRQLALGGTR